MTAMRPLTYTVEAYNVSHASENKIHDDAIAKKLGFTGGLVPGVEVFAYATHLAVERWGRAWLERGVMEAKFAKPVYDGRIATATASERADGGLDLKVESEGVLCATGEASLPAQAAAAPSLSSYAQRPPPALTARPPADETSLATGNWLSVVPAMLTEARSNEYLNDVRETNPLYAREGIAHPGLLLRLCNSCLRENVVLSPWIHVGSKVTNFGVAHVGEELGARARVTQNYDRKGHRLVDLDCVLTANDRVVARVLHTAVYKLRHLNG